MKKSVIVLLMALMVVLSGSLQAESKSIKLFGGLGLGLNKFTGLTMNLGGEMEINEKISAVAAFDYYFSPGNNVEGIDTSMFTLGAYAKYKFSSTEKMDLFAKAGLVYAKVSASTEIMGADISASSSDIGFSAGAGMEMPLGDKLSVQAGLDMFMAGTTWFKAYGNICYRIK